MCALVLSVCVLCVRVYVCIGAVCVQYVCVDIFVF